MGRRSSLVDPTAGSGRKAYLTKPIEIVPEKQALSGLSFGG
jgi:hypothetical protein